MTRTFAVLLAMTAVLLAPLPAAAEAGGGFPKGFMWGVGVSGFQHEGHFPDSNWKRYLAARKDKAPYRDSVDFRHRYREDLERAASLGVDVFRASLEWARIEPERGRIDWKEVRYYDDLVARMASHGMRPMLSLSHFVHPGWVHDQGAWKNERTIEDWLDFARFVVRRYAKYDVLWVTFNEASYYILDEVRNKAIRLSEAPVMSANLIKAHRRAYDLIHRIDDDAMVTANVAYSTVLNPLFDRALFTEVPDKLDYIGLDYYLSMSAANLTVLRVFGGEYWRIEAEPDGLYHVLHDYHRRLPHLPIYIIENGAATDGGRPQADGYQRSHSISDHVYWIHRAIKDGINVIGYNYWALLDAYEWGSYRPRFGLYTVDVESDPALERRPTEAVAAYRGIIRRNGLPAGYVPVKEPARCSLPALVTTCLSPPETPPYP
ncbi:family 1 glycosylhydrolase [Actinocorallia sp. B10E7]|uniref:family 1 glycosylhydrolase n=1 Tax=Actinocorallia sp. B10E7 TaxID=3153558 RepID=UPI00325F4768